MTNSHPTTVRVERSRDTSQTENHPIRRPSPSPRRAKRGRGLAERSSDQKTPAPLMAFVGLGNWCSVAVIHPRIRNCSPAKARRRLVMRGMGIKPSAQNSPVRSSRPRPTAGNRKAGQGASPQPFVSSEVETPAKPKTPPHPQALATPAKGDARQGTLRAIQRTKNAGTADVICRVGRLRPLATLDSAQEVFHSRRISSILCMNNFRPRTA